MVFFPHLKMVVSYRELMAQLTGNHEIIIRYFCRYQSKGEITISFSQKNRPPKKNNTDNPLFNVPSTAYFMFLLCNYSTALLQYNL